MRTDATIDRKWVKLPNASTLGYGKWRAQFGDFVVFRTGGEPDGGFPSLGRVAGRVVYAPALEPNEQPVRDWLLVITFTQDMCSVGERWVDPAWVGYCYEPQKKHAALWRFMQSDEFKEYSANDLRAWSESGFSTYTDWLAYQLRNEPTLKR